MLKNNIEITQKYFVVICNFLNPSTSTEDNENKISKKDLLKNTENSQKISINFLNFWIGDFVKIISFNGEWCFGYRLEEPEKQGIFPFSYVKEMINIDEEEKQNLAENEAERLANDISEELKEWIEIIKFNYGEGISTLCQFEQQINLIKQLLVVRRQISSGTVTTEEIREFKLSTQPLTEPFTIRLPKIKNKSQQNKALFIEILESDLENISLWMTCLFIGPINGYIGNRGGDDIRQYYAHGYIELGELLKEMVNKEQREQIIMLERKSSELLLSTSFQNNNNSSINLNNNTFKNEKIPLILNIQLFNELNNNLNSLLNLSANISIIKPLKIENENIFNRNELFIWLKDADFHGICRSEKSIEAVVSVVDDEGVFLPEAIEIITQEGSFRESSFRCRVWPSTDRPKFNELIKILLPNQEIKNLHLQILFYNKIFFDRKSIYNNNTTNYNSNTFNPKKENNNNGPFALSFLHLIKDYVLCHNDEDELFIYRLERTKGIIDGNNTTTPLSIAYLKNSSKKKEFKLIGGQISDDQIFSSSNKLRSSSTSTLPSSLDLSSIHSNNGYIFSERNTLHFQTFICSQIHCNNNLLIKILRWRDYCTNNDQKQINILKQYLIEFSYSDLNNYFNEIIKFFNNLIDSFFQIADEYLNLQEYIFVNLIHLFSYKWEELSKNKLEEYVNRMYWINASDFLLENFIKYLKNDNEDIEQLNKNSLFNTLSPKHSLNLKTTTTTAISSSSSSFTSFVKRAENDDKLKDEFLNKLFKSMELIIKLSINSKNSKIIYLIGENKNNKLIEEEKQKLIKQINLIFKLIIQFFENEENSENLIKNDSTINFNIKKIRKYRNSILKYFPHSISPLIENGIYTPLYLANYVKKIVNNVSENIIYPNKELLQFLGKIIKSELFIDVDSRSYLLEFFIEQLLSQIQPFPINNDFNQNNNILQRRASIASIFVEENIQPIGFDLQSESVELSSKILTELFELLFPHEKESKFRQIGTCFELEIILQKTLRPVIQTMVTLLGDPQLQRPLHSLLLAILDKLSAYQFKKYFSKLDHPLNKIDALSELLHMLRDLLSRCPAPKEWAQIRLTQAKIFLKIIRFSGAFLKNEFSSEIKFSGQLWLECMFSCIALIKWTCLEKVDPRRKTNLLRNYLKDNVNGIHDLFENAVNILLSLWHSLNPEQKIQLLPEMVGPSLDLTFLNNSNNISFLIFPIFFDMLYTECFIKFTKTLTTITSTDVVLRKTFFQKQTLQQQQTLNKSLFFEEFVKKLDIGFDELIKENNYFIFNEFKIALNKIFNEKIMTLESEEINSLNVVNSLTSTIKFFVKSINKLIDLYSSYFSILKIENQTTSQIETGLFCTVQLIEFYYEMGQNNLYLIYLYKLYDLHISSGNLIEAAITLQRHSSLLNWTNECPLKYLYGARKQNLIFNTQIGLKEYIYLEMIKLFEQGKHWELAIEINKELINVYETILFDYKKLSELLKNNALLYEKIIKELRFESNYFLVAFYGKGCPSYLKNKKFIFRGQPLESWSSFKQRFLSTFSDFKFIESIEICNDEINQINDKYVQIITVTPLPSPFYLDLLSSPSRLTCWYFKYHKVQRFEFVKREFKNDTKWTELENNENMRLWLQKKIFTIQRPLPDLLTFLPIINEQELPPLNPIEVAIEKVKEANDKLADLSSKVAEGFISEYYINLGGMIRGIVQADVGGGIKNYQPFFSAQCRLQCTEEENRCIEHLMFLILEQITLLEYSLYIHANNSPTTTTNTTTINSVNFHNSLVSSFNSHKFQIETQFGKTSKSLLPEGASIYSKIEQKEIINKMQTISNESNNFFNPSSTIITNSSPTTSRAFRSHSVSEFQNSQNEINISIRNSQISSSSSNNSGSSNFFRNSPIETAGNLIKNTIQQAKAKQKQRKSLVPLNKRRNTSANLTTKIDENKISKTSQFLRILSQKQQISSSSNSSIIPTSFKNTRISDCSLDNFCFPLDTNAPLLPPRQSNFHSNVLICTKSRVENTQNN